MACHRTERVSHIGSRGGIWHQGGQHEHRMQGKRASPACRKVCVHCLRKKVEVGDTDSDTIVETVKIQREKNLAAAIAAVQEAILHFVETNFQGFAA